LLAYDADRPAVEAARRDPRQFEALYRKYVAQIYSFALYELRDPHAAEDVKDLPQDDQTVVDRLRVQFARRPLAAGVARLGATS
jgi:hypothetical protein